MGARTVPEGAPAPLKPRPRLFRALLGLFALWIVALWVMWWRWT